MNEKYYHAQAPNKVPFTTFPSFIETISEQMYDILHVVVTHK